MNAQDCRHIFIGSPVRCPPRFLSPRAVAHRCAASIVFALLAKHLSAAVMGRIPLPTTTSRFIIISIDGAGLERAA